MIKNENIFSSNIFKENLEKYKKINKLKIFRTKNVNNKNELESDNNKSNNIYSLCSLDTKEDLNTISSKYKLCNNKTKKIEYISKKQEEMLSYALIQKILNEIPEEDEERFMVKTKKRIYSGAKYVYDKCEIL